MELPVHPNIVNLTLIEKGERQGIPFVVARNHDIGIFLAYIAVPESHPWFWLANYDDCPLDVHGGVTWSRKDGVWAWFGWDYGHAGDWSEISHFRGDKKWSPDEVSDDITEAIGQALAAAKK